MRNSLIIAKRELRERLENRSFIAMLFIGPLLILAFIYFLLQFGDQGKTNMKVLIVDPSGLLENKITSQESKALTYYFYDDYIEIAEFKDGKRFQEFDAMIELNEKVLINKKVFLFYREAPSVDLKMKMKFEVERRVEEVMIEQFTQLSVNAFRQIKQPLNIDFRSVYDPKNEADNSSSWVGFFFGLIILFFISLFGMTVLRGIAKDKSNRIVELMLASVKSRDMLLGKIMGIGWAALLQLFIWTLLVGLGLFVFKSFFFKDIFDASSFEGIQMSEEVKNEILTNSSIAKYNAFIDLIYHRINFWVMIPHFVLLFVLSYLFYASFFSAIGATAGTESDGQQFVIPIFVVLMVSVYAGYMSVYWPDSQLAHLFLYLPFTSAMVILINISNGFAIGSYVETMLSALILIVSSGLFLSIAARLYKNGILIYGHSLRLRNLFQWLKKS